MLGVDGCGSGDHSETEYKTIQSTNNKTKRQVCFSQSDALTMPGAHP